MIGRVRGERQSFPNEAEHYHRRVAIDVLEEHPWGNRIRLDQRGLSLSDPPSGSRDPLHPLLSPRVFPPKAALWASPVRKPTSETRLFLPSSMLSLISFDPLARIPALWAAPPPRSSPSSSLPIRQGESQKSPPHRPGGRIEVQLKQGEGEKRQRQKGVVGILRLK